MVINIIKREKVVSSSVGVLCSCGYSSSNAMSSKEQQQQQENGRDISSKLAIVQKAFMAPFAHKKTDSTRILSDCMPFTF